MSSPIVLHVVSELFPFVKTGGLADVVGALPQALREEGIDARVLVPGYPQILAAAGGGRIVLEIPDLFRAGPARVLFTRLGASTVPTYVLDCPGLFVRKGGPYHDAAGRDFADNHLRFGALGWVAAELATSTDAHVRADVVHAHDWQAGLALAYLRLKPGAHPRGVATIHSVAYPGSFDRTVLPELGLPSSAFAIDGVEFFGSVSFLKAALHYADRITTVSPTYAKEIQEDGMGGGFEGLLRFRNHDLVGILNGVDYSEWNPATDRHLPARYSASDLRGKAVMRTLLQKRLGLALDPDRTLFGVVSRLVWQKGIDWVAASVPWLIERGAQLVVLGSGDASVADVLAEHARLRPDRVAMVVGYDEELSHWIQAASDSILVPSRAEPCGLTQLYALRYGSPPVVRRTGGLADTVSDVNEASLQGRVGTGFSFDEPSAPALRVALERAIELRERPSAFRPVQMAAMAADFGWSRSASRYAALYRSLLP